ncbi:uncharacterized protein BXZ73DRAFT_43112 [Epithele typhae]|uniref:uncharacterized protein n=1 Tax=Epithele typhae TaxID=378194 RepID=UPI0020085F17|nr:uncharacterized protein BXZ73DRAFT_43112 [Epithele typhae]KAH9940124.1 hypothetical protein BXZ73DRAFT_43112 [Epithele typhae]
MPTLQPYNGSVKKLVLAIDVGTTHSGIAYTILDPGEVPKIHSITRFPGQEDTAGNFKIPSVILYAPNGSVAYAGAEATALGMDTRIQDESLVSAEWYLHLRPRRLGSTELKKNALTPLPPGKTAAAVFADFLKYLFACAKSFIRETHANGEKLWTSLENHIEFVLSHPNGWEGLQQGTMRQTAIMAGLVPDTPEGRGRVHFVTEGEASLNFCIHNGLTNETMKEGQSVIIVDAGGGTVDISSYEFTSIAPLVVEETRLLTALAGILHGSTRVNVRAKTYLQDLLKKSPFGNKDDIDSMMEQFDKATKRVFKDEKQTSYIKFGSMKCNDPKVNISRGQLTLSGYTMRSFFRPSFDAIVNFIIQQRREATKPPNMVFLVGGFAASPWLYSELKARLTTLGLTLCRPDSHTDKAVSSGALCFYLEHFVSARVAKITYGIAVDYDYNPRDAEHLARTSKTHGTRVRETEEIAHSYLQSARYSTTLNNISCDILCFRGTNKDPRWMDADTSRIERVPELGLNGVYYSQSFDVVLLCGLTELQAQIRWYENIAARCPVCAVSEFLYPGQEDSAGDFKIPSIILYTPHGTVAYAGAEATAPGMDVQIQDESLVRVEWFKLHLRPPRLGSNELKKNPLPPLPFGKTADAVFADFLGYLFTCARRFICETHANGESLWTSLEHTMEFVLSHPNGWEGLQQGRMRQMAIMAGLIPNTDYGRTRVHFVTEGEASLNFCVHNGLATETMKTGQSVIIVDAGGGTVDISSYEFTSMSPLTVEEVNPPDCLLQGSTRVNVRAEAYLKGSSFGNDEDIQSMLEHFDKMTKRVFKDESQSSYIKFGSLRCNDASVGISRGQLTLRGDVMRSFFRPSLDAIVNIVTRQSREAIKRPNMVFLVGGFAANPWLYSELKSRLQTAGLTLCRPDSHTDKAVSSGALCYYLERFVTARVARMTYGIEVACEYDPNDPEHTARRTMTYVDARGIVSLSNGFFSMLKRGTRVRETEEISYPYVQQSRTSNELNSIECDVLAFRGPRKDPHWTDVNPEQYTTLCTIHADTSRITRIAKHGLNGVYYTQEFDVVLLCGLTEMQAQIRWREKVSYVGSNCRKRLTRSFRCSCLLPGTGETVCARLHCHRTTRSAEWRGFYRGPAKIVYNEI